MIDKYSTGKKRVGTGYEVQIVEIIHGIQDRTMMHTQKTWVSE